MVVCGFAYRVFRAVFFFFKQKTAYEMRISDWSSDVCSSDLDPRETMAHYRAVAQASGLPVMCYNNPVVYGVDITPEMFAELADEPTLEIGSASCRERVCQYVSISVVAVSLTKKRH